MKRVSVALAFVLGACGGSGHPAGELGGSCYPDMTCDTGLACIAGSCSAAAVDSAPACADGSAYLPDDSPGNPYQTGVAQAQSSTMMDGLAICPAGDKDMFVITVTQSTNLAVSLDYVSSPLSMAVLNTNGLTLAPGMPGDGQDEVTTTVSGIPAGVYYVRVESPSSDPGATSDYALTITTH